MWSAVFSMNILILFAPINRLRALSSLPWMSMCWGSPRLNSSVISRLESSACEESMAYSTIFSGSLRSMVAEVVPLSM